MADVPHRFGTRAGFSFPGVEVDENFDAVTGPTGPTGPTGATGATGGFSGSNNAATAVGGEATLNALTGVITSETLIGSTVYQLTLTNSNIHADSTVLVSATASTNIACNVITILAASPGNGQCTIAVLTAALTGTLTIRFAVFN